MKQQLDMIQLWLNALPPRDRQLLFAIIGMLAVTLFYLVIWEPVTQGYEQERQNFKSQRDIYAWMQSAASEVQVLKRSGNVKTRSNHPITLILENTAKNSGLTQQINKIESSGKEGARVKIDSITFDQLLVWLNTLEQQHGVTITTATIERNEQSGSVNARLSFDKLP
ncbi:MAG: type II secretion system protein M [Gammaproteobacteria bacterium]|nr:type II secretion system protein M [Gammaproteobacteria bacterium]